MKKRITIMFVSSAGGHLTQLLRLHADYDHKTSMVITERTPSTENLTNKLNSPVLFLPHGGRENFLPFIFKFLWNATISLIRVLRYRPDVIVTTGAHTAVPTCIYSKLIGSKLIYIESFARIKSPSLTGRILHPFADRFYVQWPNLQSHYKKAQYKGKLY